MELAKTDIDSIIRLLEVGADIIDRYAASPHECDKARLMRNMSRKIRKKFNKENDVK